MMYLYLFSPNGTEVQFRYGAAATTGISLYAGKHLYINAPNAAITSNRTGTGADIVVKNYISNDRTNEGSLFIKAKSAGTPDRPLVINAPNMGSAAIMAAELTGTASGTTDGSMYIKNIYFPGSVPPLPVKIWKIQSANQTDGTISLYNSSAGIEQPAQAGGIAAEHLHISAAREINLTTNNTIKKTDLIICF